MSGNTCIRKLEGSIFDNTTQDRELKGFQGCCIEMRSAGNHTVARFLLPILPFHTIPAIYSPHPYAFHALYPWLHAPYPALSPACWAGACPAKEASSQISSWSEWQRISDASRKLWRGAVFKSGSLAKTTSPEPGGASLASMSPGVAQLGARAM